MLDEIVDDGTAFLNAFSQYPNTLAATASLFTSHYPRETGVTDHPFGLTSSKLPTLAEIFADRGHVTAAVTENAFVSSTFGFGRGFDLYVDGEPTVGFGTFEGSAANTFRRAAEFLQSYRSSAFFLFVQTYHVHSPYAPAPEILERLLTPEDRNYSGEFTNSFPGGLVEFAHNSRTKLLSADDFKRLSLLYDAEVVSLDAHVADFIAALKHLDLFDSTLLVILSDHGEEFGEHGYLGHGANLHDESLRVPLIFRLPGRIPAGRRIETPVGLVDVGVTITDLAGYADAYPSTSGRSRAHEILGEEPGDIGPVFSELTRSVTACRDGEERPDALSGCPYDGVAVRDEKFAFIISYATGEHTLYDLADDPRELIDVAHENTNELATYRVLADGFRARKAVKGTLRDDAEITENVEKNLRALGYIE